LRLNHVVSPALPASFDGYTIFHLSDLHADTNARAIARLTELAKDARYDIRVLTGDIRGPTKHGARRRAPLSRSSPVAKAFPRPILSPGAAAASRTSNARARYSSARYRKPRQARSRNSSCATAQNILNSVKPPPMRRTTSPTLLGGGGDVIRRFVSSPVRSAGEGDREAVGATNVPIRPPPQHSDKTLSGFSLSSTTWKCPIGPFQLLPVTST
jgi:hypothetical protein